MKIDDAILSDLLALADEIRQVERCTARQALRRAVREWTRLEHDADALGAEPTRLPLRGPQIVKAA